MPKKKTAKKRSAKKTSATMTKAAFVRSMPEDMSAEEVIAKGKARGISLNKMAVYKNRSNARTAAKMSSAGAGAAAKKPSAKGATTTRRGKAPDKTIRVLELVAQNPNWTAQEVADAAKCSVTHVYSVWRQKPKAARGSANGTATPKSPVMQHLDHVRALRGVILHVGIDQAKAMMDQIVRDLLVLPH